MVILNVECSARLVETLAKARMFNLSAKPMLDVELYQEFVVGFVTLIIFIVTNPTLHTYYAYSYIPALSPSSSLR